MEVHNNQSPQSIDITILTRETCVIFAESMSLKDKQKAAVRLHIAETRGAGCPHFRFFRASRSLGSIIRPGKQNRNS